MRTLSRHLICIFYIFIIVTHLSSCSSENADDVNQDRIYTDYELFYDKNEDKTYAKATFRFGNAGGTSLKLSDKSQVFFNNEVLTYDPVFSYYQKSIAGFIKTGTFKWQDNAGKNYSNNISVPEVDFLAPTLKNISRDSTYEIKWNGEPVKDKESISILITSSGGGTPQIYIQSLIGSNNILFARNQMQALNSGTATLVMDRKFQPELTMKTSAGGTISGKSRAKNATALIK